MAEESVAEDPFIEALVVVAETLVVEPAKKAPAPPTGAPGQMLDVAATALVLLVLSAFLG